MRRRLLSLVALTLAMVVALPALSAFACGGLIAKRHGEVLRKATTLAAWVGGIEHYITGFEFAGVADSFGYIIPLPAAPSEVRKGGDWTLERLEREAFPRKEARAAFDQLALAPSPGGVTVLKAVKIDSLDIKVVKGGGRDVAAWAREHDFDLTKDTDDLLASYKADIFALAKFDKAEASQRFVEGQGVVIDFEIPLPGPWIPLRILSLGKSAAENVDAHLFLLTPEKPMLSPAPSTVRGMHVVKDEQASSGLISDLRSDTGTSWVPEKMWFTALDLSAPAPTVRYDMAGVNGGAIFPVALDDSSHVDTAAWWLVAVALGVATLGLFRRVGRGSAK